MPVRLPIQNVRRKVPLAVRSMQALRGGTKKVKFPGDHSEGETPVPIPNTEAKPLSGDGTMRATAWESSTSPG